ncbi:MAG TPA: KpsF/GutQ family sugar-phosphate isomerase [Vitreimonas sp.]|uniref:KpsF/GutQ family sugar-phosphate isomerase n=1 Tax=Vitreimonas sp. TaxID=3069702 RepID=UPI002D68EF6B|nr:KpsF/GutQ family sugar-phosphate isomerase [Vitreimonas sp.]HYD87589.1 KpsF/GutQ family sugar-phosphate isomerase [Vitreimonas sp.]
MSIITPAAAVAAGQDTIRAEARSLDTLAEALAGELKEPFVHAARLLAETKGRVIVSGMGKSGHIARKIAATLASTGTPAQFVHPAEASHGDLGMIVESDCVLAISRSGETRELSDMLYHCRRIHVPIIGMTFKAGSSLAAASTAALVLPECGEASEDAPAPTISTTMCLALGDALAVALIKARGFTAEHFGAIHPGGKLGAALKRVRDIMRVGQSDPLVSPELSVPEAMQAMSVGGIGAAGVVEGGKLIGIITDGDLRRKLTPEMFARRARDIMTANPKTIAPDAPIADAIAIMNEKRITLLFAVEDGRPVGVVHMHDLLAAGVR